MQQVSSLYIHFPFCRHLCNYCDFFKNKLTEGQQVVDFEKRLKVQLDENKILLKDQECELSSLETIYIGGGTPSLWSERGAEFLEKNLLANLKLKDGHEFTIEIDPGTWTPSEIEKWLKIGVNRFSIGIQSFDSKFLKILDREHTMEEATDLLSYLKSEDFNYSVDLMLGLPDSEVIKRNIKSEIDELIKYNPSHFSVYILKTRKNYAHSSILPSEEYIAKEYIDVCNYLASKGFEQYEVSNFSKPGYESKHNKKYWQYNSVAAVGDNASGLLVKQDSAIRYQWKSVGAGCSKEVLTESSLLIEMIYMKLRAGGMLNIDFFQGDNKHAFEGLLDRWKSLGYIKKLVDGDICLAAEGYLVLDSLMDDIFRDLSL